MVHGCLFAVQATTSECECKYFETEREALALFWACKRYRAYTYIYEIKFDLVTDQKLEVIYGHAPNPVPALIAEQSTYMFSQPSFTFAESEQSDKSSTHSKRGNKVVR